MKRILNNPLLFGLSVFLLIFLGGSLAGFILGMIAVSQPCERFSPSDPCDGGAMAAGMIWSLAFTASLVVGIVLGSAIVVIIKIKKSRDKSFD